MEKSCERGHKNLRRVEVGFSVEAKEVYDYLKERAPASKIERSILRAVDRKIELIRENPRYGNHVSYKRIPKEYIEKYGAEKVFRVELPNFWRMLYSTGPAENEVDIFAFILGIMDHKEYDRKFKKR